MREKIRQILPIGILCAAILVSTAGGWYWYEHFVDRSGWVEEEGVRYYRDFYGDPVSGWLELGQQRYFLHNDGTPYTGFQGIDGTTYYFDPSGIMVTGWQEVNGNTYYFGGNGTMVEGWLWLGEFRYYLDQGILVTGWKDIEGNRYFFDADGIMYTGFLNLEEGRYYFDSEGILATGVTALGEEIYCFQEDGKMRTGWEETEEGTRYFSPEGPMVVGWQEIEGKRYYFDESGWMARGWLQQGQYRYYLTEDGSAAVGPTVIEGSTHYFSPKGIDVILINARNPVPADYQPDLVNVVDYHDVDQICYDALVQMLQDCNNAGIDYIFNSAYRTLKEQTAILENRTQEYMENLDMDFSQARDKALETVAVPGTSEHHLGLAVDLLGDEAVAWFQEHCWDYGFIVRYRSDKEYYTGIIDEPWHFRYVGKEVALDLKDSGLCLEEYLGAAPVKG